MRSENYETLRGVVRIAKVTWIVFWALLLAKYYIDAAESPTVVIEGSIFFTVVLYFAGFPLSPLMGAAATALAGSSQHGSVVVNITMAVAGYVQWFVLAPRLWRVFQKGEEIKL